MGGKVDLKYKSPLVDSATLAMMTGCTKVSRYTVLSSYAINKLIAYEEGINKNVPIFFGVCFSKKNVEKKSKMLRAQS